MRISSGSVQPSVPTPDSAAPVRGLSKATPRHLGPRRAPLRSYRPCGGLRNYPPHFIFTPILACRHPESHIGYWVSFPLCALSGLSTLGNGTGAIRVGLSDTTPIPVDTAPSPGRNTYRTRNLKVLLNTCGNVRFIYCKSRLFKTCIVQ